MLLTILSSLKFCTAAAHYLHMYEKLYYFCSVVVYNVVLEIVKQFSISSICFLASSFFFFLFSSCYRILTLSLVVTMMSSNIWACQSSKSISGLLPGGILTSDFWTSYYCLPPLGVLLISFLYLWSKMDFHLDVVVIKFVTFPPFYSINLLCVWHFELK